MKLLCKKCGSEHEINRLEHKFCPDCGTAYDHLIIAGDLESIVNHPLFLKTAEMHDRWVAGDYKSKEFDLVSDNAVSAMGILKGVSADHLKSNFTGDEAILELIVKHEEVLDVVFMEFMFSGYFAWIAEKELLNDPIHPVQSIAKGQFLDECTKNFDSYIYNDFLNHLKGSDNPGFFSKESAEVFQVFIHSLWTACINSGQIFELQNIFKELQISCTDAMVMGYALAITDAKYRK